MLIKKVKIRNIRSYREAEINFPTGSTLLSGDIGSGKSTVLLAIEFALFGTRRGGLSGAVLLRNGESTGSVELEFELDGKNIIVSRSLVRGKTSVAQDVGYIVIDGERKDLSATELKQEIINLLKYPQEFLTKSKDLIYRYTVYTPQEEMKHILLENAEERLNILRRVFGIDKYKTVIGNTKLFVSKMKGKVKEFSGFVSDLEDKRRSRDEIKNKISKLNEDILRLNPLMEAASNELTRKKNEIGLIEGKIARLNEVKSLISGKNSKVDSLNGNIGRVKKELEILVKEILEMGSEVKEIIDLNELKLQIKEKEEEISSLEMKIESIKKTVRTYEVRTEHANEIKGKFHELDKCPTCKQIVQDTHKKSIFIEQDKIIAETEKELESFKESLEGKENLMVIFKKDLEKLKNSEREIELNNLKLRNLNEKKNKENSLNEEIVKTESELRIVESELKTFKIELFDFEGVNENYSKLKLELDNCLENLRKVEVEKSGIEREVATNKSFLENLENEILEKEKVKGNIEKLIGLQSFFEKDFINLMETIERKIMLKAFSEFDVLFKNWFEILIDSDLLKVGINEEFTPVIEQAGHDIDYLHLSGGEKTAAALAYRLALNQVINDMMSSIKTRDLIILDEPTDGFSEAQLDRLRLVLDELKIKQIILVSHESKIESFVDNIISLSKKDHVSAID
jgi:DNA repair protein SbcC/Rad50